MWKRIPKDTQFIILTLILVIFMAVPTYYTIANEPMPLSNPARSIAAIREVEVDAEKVTMTMLHDFACATPKTKSLSVQGGFVQLSGKLCKSRAPGDVTIVNKQNGFTASVFEKGQDQYQTDFIQLQSGTNEIHIRYSNSKGKIIEEVLRIQSL